MISDNIEKLITLYLVNNSAMTKEQRFELSDWISSSHENATYFAKSAYLHRNTNESLCYNLI